MIKRISILLVLFTSIVVLASCNSHNAFNPTDILSVDEIHTIENLYFSDFQAVSESLNLDNRLHVTSDGMRWALPEEKNIQGQAFSREFLVSIVEPEGLMGFEFNLAVETSAEDKELVKKIYDDLVRAYGEPDTPDSYTQRISTDMEKLTHDGINQHCLDYWEVSENTQCTFSVSKAENPGTGVVYVVYNLTYRPSVEKYSR